MKFSFFFKSFLAVCFLNQIMSIEAMDDVIRKEYINGVNEEAERKKEKDIARMELEFQAAEEEYNNLLASKKYKIHEQTNYYKERDLKN